MSDTNEERRRLTLDALSLEYNSLRSELTEKTTKNQQTTTLLLAAVAAVTAVAGAKTDKYNPVLYGAAIALGLYAIITWWANGRTIGKVSGHVAQVEAEINGLVNETVDSKVVRGEPQEKPVYLDWETRHQSGNRRFAFAWGKALQRRVPR